MRTGSSNGRRRRPACRSRGGICCARWRAGPLEGRYPRARELNLAAAQLAAGLGDPTGIGLGYAHAMSVATIRGEPGDLLDGTTDMLASVPSMPLVRAQMASMLLLLDQREEAFGLYEELRAELDSMVADLRWGPTLFNLADLAVAFDLRRLEMPGPLLRADRLAAAVARARDDADPLTAREREVADLVVRALSNRDIAARLVLSEHTVESHVRSILAKLGCANRAELIARRPAGG